MKDFHSTSSISLLSKINKVGFLRGSLLQYTENARKSQLMKKRDMKLFPSLTNLYSCRKNDKDMELALEYGFSFLIKIHDCQQFYNYYHRIVRYRILSITLHSIQQSIEKALFALFVRHVWLKTPKFLFFSALRVEFDMQIGVNQAWKYFISRISVSLEKKAL